MFPRFAACCLLAVASAFVASCAHRPPPPPPATLDTQPFDKRLAEISVLQNAKNYEAFRPHFTKEATIQSPITPRPANVDTYIRLLQTEPYLISFGKCEAVYSEPGRIVTLTDVACAAPGRFTLKERATISWRFEDGHWRIARISFGDWPSIYGTWRRSGLRNEDSIELRVQPGGSYVIYLGEDYSVPAYRGTYRIESNRITLSDTMADDPKQFQRGEGIYTFTRTAKGIVLAQISEDNTWRAERFQGEWTSR